MQAILISSLVVISLTSAAPQTDRKQLFQPARIVPIVSISDVRDDYGQFALSYVTGDGQTFVEQGALERNLDDENYVLVKRGYFSYTAPDGTPIFQSYIADRDGYRATGNHLPVAPQEKKPSV
ncbi:endocuticle structural glycoprotein SgAbd-2-like [Lycorma delicatula]|uniref:endocuticle structural glycoprotein SgAbd-2-like n=1 Tax=Lycorma delicatula TaxID=130591 RepID=UPI003F51477D